MSALQQPLWAMPDDGIRTDTSDAQLDVERSLAAYLAPFHRRPDAHEPSRQPTRPHMHNPWIDSDMQQATAADGQASRAKTKAKPPPALNRAAHLAFLSRWLQPLPGAYVGFDSNRAWILFWVTHGHDLLRAGLPPSTRARAITTILSFQHPEGGFGGGPGQIPHLMSTYPALCALAIVGGPGMAPRADVLDGDSTTLQSCGGWDAVDRQAMYRWMLSLKQPDGSFIVHAGGEVDVRASYCVMCISLLLGICTPELIDGMQEFIVSCQTYEGGIAASSQPSLSQLSSPPLGEAHGGYAHCALASYLSITSLCETYREIAAADKDGPTLSKLSISADDPVRLDLDSLLRWACSQQGLAIELGAFRGRTNKLVDGCYGWFGGAGLFAVLDACLLQERGKRKQPSVQGKRSKNGPAGPDSAPGQDASTTEEADDGWSTESEDEQDALGVINDDSLFDFVALQEYILIAAQTSLDLEQTGANAGGLRDKPSKKADAYHTCYNLSGLSLCQHRIVSSKDAQLLLEQRWKSVAISGDGAASSRDLSSTTDRSQVSATSEQDDKWRKACYVSALAWLAEPQPAATGRRTGRVVGDPKLNTVMPTHPIFNMTFPRVKAMMDWAYSQS